MYINCSTGKAFSDNDVAKKQQIQTQPPSIAALSPPLTLYLAVVTGQSELVIALNNGGRANV